MKAKSQILNIPGLRYIPDFIVEAEIANERKLTAPLMMQKQPPNNNATDIYEYSRMIQSAAILHPVFLRD
jgi:hypothetical protein